MQLIKKLLQKHGTIDAQIALIETRRDNTKGQLDVYNDEKENIN